MDVDVTWKILGVANPTGEECEKESDPNKVGKLNLACIQIPAMLRPKRNAGR